MKRLGPLSGIVGMLPGLPKEMRNAEIDEGNVTRIEAVIRSMTPAERNDPAIINGSRRTGSPPAAARRRPGERPPEPVQGDAEDDALVGDDGTDAGPAVSGTSARAAG